jgi:large subunit ribosomal protein L49
MYKYRNFRTTLTKRADIGEDYLKKFLVRQPVNHLKKLHPRAKLIYNRMIQAPKPLDFKPVKVLSEKEREYSWEVSKSMDRDNSIPFTIKRTHTDNLPVYSEYNHDHTIKRTVVRLIEGDVGKFVNELRKIVSNSDIKVKTGKVLVNGLHALKIKIWLRSLGF